VVPDAIRRAAAETFPGVPVFATMGTGASDSKYLRLAGIAAYGIDVAPSEDSDARRAHGHDERLPSAWLRPGYEFFSRLVRLLAQ
jgi:acetylornithine deacetylase/succinyl-diaminopimelate desuccinylase-like protein